MPHSATEEHHTHPLKAVSPRWAVRPRQVQQTSTMPQVTRPRIQPTLHLDDHEEAEHMAGPHCTWDNMSAPSTTLTSVKSTASPLKQEANQQDQQEAHSTSH